MMIPFNMRIIFCIPLPPFTHYVCCVSASSLNTMMNLYRLDLMLLMRRMLQYMISCQYFFCCIPLVHVITLHLIFLFFDIVQISCLILCLQMEFKVTQRNIMKWGILFWCSKFAYFLLFGQLVICCWRIYLPEW